MRLASIAKRSADAGAYQGLDHRGAGSALAATTFSPFDTSEPEHRDRGSGSEAGMRGRNVCWYMICGLQQVAA
jgi:hypothetical protein